jgi:hypothetical protein
VGFQLDRATRPSRQALSDQLLLGLGKLNGGGNVGQLDPAVGADALRKRVGHPGDQLNALPLEQDAEQAGYLTAEGACRRLQSEASLLEANRWAGERAHRYGILHDGANSPQFFGP